MNKQQAALLSILILAAAMTTGCVTSQARIGSTGTSIGFGLRSGAAVTISSYGDYLCCGPGSIYSANRQGVKELNAGNYEDARRIFESTLQQSPGHPDSTYYLGLTLIYLGERDAGFKLLKSYKDPNSYRGTRGVVDRAEYLAKKPDLTPDVIHGSMNKERVEGYDRGIREKRDILYDR